jgi:hypothetical protein
MQLSTRWARTASLQLSETSAPTGRARLVTSLRSVRVLKSPREFVTLFGFATLYWFVAAIVCQPILFPLVWSAHETGSLKIILVSLAVFGVVGIANEIANCLATSHIRPLKWLAFTLSGVILLTTFGYWASEDVFTVLIDMAAKAPPQSLSFIAGNCFLMATNIILPTLGCAFLARLAHHLLRLPRVS